MFQLNSTAMYYLVYSDVLTTPSLCLGGNSLIHAMMYKDPQTVYSQCTNDSQPFENYIDK